MNHFFRLLSLSVFLGLTLLINQGWTEEPVASRVVVDQFGLLPPNPLEFKTSIPYVYNLFNSKRKREREIAAYWVDRETHLKTEIADCQKLNEKSLVQQCYEQVRTIENRLTESAVTKGQLAVQNMQRAQRNTTTNCTPNGYGGYNCTNY